MPDAWMRLVFDIAETAKYLLTLYIPIGCIKKYSSLNANCLYTGSFLSLKCLSH